MSPPLQKSCTPCAQNDKNSAAGWHCKADRGAGASPQSKHCAWPAGTIVGRHRVAICVAARGRRPAAGSTGCSGRASDTEPGSGITRAHGAKVPGPRPSAPRGGRLTGGFGSPTAPAARQATCRGTCAAAQQPSAHTACSVRRPRAVLEAAPGARCNCPPAPPPPPPRPCPPGRLT